MVALLLTGMAGAGLVLLGTRQEVAQVVIVPQHPLPATATAVSGQGLLPAASALAVATLASLAAVVATRGLPRQVTGLVAIGLGVAIGLSAAARVSVAGVLAVARHTNLSPASGAGGGVFAGSTTAGSGTAQPSGSLAGFPAHVLFAGSAWRVLMLAGAVLIVLVGVGVVALARRLPALSGRYERSVARAASTAPKPEAARACHMWDSLSVGADPTAGPDEGTS